jgi:hypothetical protein
VAGTVAVVVVVCGALAAGFASAKALVPASINANTPEVKR